MLGRNGRSSDLKREGRPHYAVGSGKRLPEMPSLVGLGIDGDSNNLLDCKRFGEGLIRDVEDWRHRQMRRLEGAYSPNVERRARHYAKRYNLSMPRARLVASLDGGAQ